MLKGITKQDEPDTPDTFAPSQAQTEVKGEPSQVGSAPLPVTVIDNILNIDISTKPGTTKDIIPCALQGMEAGEAQCDKCKLKGAEGGVVEGGGDEIVVEEL